MKHLKLFFSVMVLFSSLTPALALAQGTSAQCEELKKIIQLGGGGELISQLPTYCTQESAFSKILTTLFWALGPLAVLLYIYGGYLYMSSGASEANKKKGKDVLLYTTIGVSIAILSGLIVRVVINLTVSGQVF